MRRSPEDKKALSYAKDRRNAYGANDKASRKRIPRRKREVNKVNRHAARLQLNAATGPIDAESAEEAEIRLKGARGKSWRKFPDQPLGEVLAWKRLRARRRQVAQRPG